VDATVGAVTAAPGSGSAASVTSMGPGASGAGTSLTPLAVSPGGSFAPGSISAPNAVASPARAAVLPGAAPAGVNLTPAASLRNGPAVAASPVAAPARALPGTNPAALAGPNAAMNPASNPAANPAVNGAAAPANAAGNAATAPGARATLGGAAGKVADARLDEASGVGDGLSVAHALDRVFDAASAQPALRSDGVAGKAQSVRDAVAQKVGIANTSSPADAPSLYLDAIKTAKDALPAPVADGVARVVRGFASRKADASFGDLLTTTLRAAAGGSASEAGRQVGAFDKWEALLGSSARPLVQNREDIKASVADLLARAQAPGASVSAPHAYFEKHAGSFVAVFPAAGAASAAAPAKGSPIQAVPALAASFAIVPAALAPQTALTDAYRAFAADPRAATGAGLIYRARRTLGSSVPAAVWSASRFWLRTMLAAAWHRLVAFFGGAKTYALNDRSGQDALRRDAASASSARAEASSAERLLSGTKLTVADANAAFAALSRSAAALRALTGENDAFAAVEDLRASFASASAARGLRAGDEVPAGLLMLVDAPAAHWAARISDEASRVLDARFWSSRGGADSIDLGAKSGAGARAAAMAKGLSGPAAFVTLDERLWARGRGVAGEALLSADLRPTASGGSVELTVERADAALGRRLEDLGFTVVPQGAGLYASITPEDFSRDADELGLVAARALSAALGRESVSAPADLKALADDARRDPADAAALAAALDGREAFARAPVMGLVGAYEALAPTPVVVGGKPLMVSALRDPDTGLLSYARAAKPDGAALGAVELRALLRAR
jgi:hypothetical protein